MISSTDNAQVKHLIQLNKKAKTRRETGTYIIEGIRMFREVPPELLVNTYVSESFEHDNAEALNGVSYEVLSDKVFAHVSDTVTPQGVMSIVRMREHSLEEMTGSGEAPLLILLDGLQDPGNLGTIMRTGEGAGITGVIMSRTTVDIYNPKTIRSTMGSLYRVPHIVVDDIAATARQLADDGISVVATELGASKCYDEIDYSRPTAIFVGNEGNGLSSEALAAATDKVIIPMKGQVESLNAAVAASICMYEAARQRR